MHEVNANDVIALAAAIHGADAVVRSARFSTLKAAALLATLKTASVKRLVVVGGVAQTKNPLKIGGCLEARAGVEPA
ncbi:hypothetical protein KPG66_03320 [Mycetohabitans sp. B2]|uniref:hypothetical protein n=1 Tax=Mycetohabitans sp. B2 TaxID=2841274 RepID=UPI001F4096AC|nr:hypothetical protein [Mycetohabitans sp. B2]MCF7695181.1 hypothetical protein [Mycetohabitans sp. B2]